MYTYIMQRTQIYLSEDESAALDREARRRGTSRSHLIREAVRDRYIDRIDPQELRAQIGAAAGGWLRGNQSDQESGETYVERLRTGRRLRDLFPGGTDHPSDTGGVDH
jgi:predicted transcriptional regulator